MAAPKPTSPLALPNYSQDRGPILFDRITKSTRNKPTGYVKKDVCGDDAYWVFGASLSINQNTPNCENVLAASGSISLTVPINATSADVLVVLNALIADIQAKRTELQG